MLSRKTIFSPLAKMKITFLSKVIAVKGLIIIKLIFVVVVSKETEHFVPRAL